MKLISDESTEWYLPSKTGDLHVDHGEAEHAGVLHRLVDALLDRGDELAGDGAADDLVDELEPAAALERFDAEERDPELPVAAGLLLVLALGLRLVGDRLAVGDLHVLGLDFHAELGAEARLGDPEVRLALTPQQRLVGLGVAFEPQRGVFVEEPVQRVRELVLVALRLRLDRDGEHGRGRFERLDVDVGAARAEDVAGRGVGQLGHRRDVAGGNLRHRLLLLAPHQRQLVQALLVHRAPVHERGVGLHRALQAP